MSCTRLLTAAVIAAVFCACGPKRPPASSNVPPPPPEDVGASTSRPSGDPLDSGPDVRSLDEEGTSGADLSGPDGEGGPLADVRFDFDSAKLGDEARATLEKHAYWLQNHRDVKVRVEGHCDERGTVEYNLALGDQRAQVAREYLVSLGVAGDRLTALSYGKERPLDAGHDEGAWARNRRAHFAVSR